MKIMHSISPFITTFHVVREKKPVTFAYRTPRGELFLLSRDAIRSETDFVRNVKWEDLIASDESLDELKKLSPNYAAFRNSPNEMWQVSKIDQQTETGSYIDQHLEWISKMYVDGYFTGGTYPHWIYIPRSSKKYAYVNFLIGGLLAILGFYIFFSGGQLINDNVIVAWLAGVIFILMGVRVLSRARKR
jgi:hypothetical protein